MSQVSLAAIEVLLDKYYHGPRQVTDQAFVICCPWHEDSAPSCNIYPKSGVFFCWRCHFGKSKGVGPREGFKALGVPHSELETLHEEVLPEEFSSQPLFLLEQERELEAALEGEATEASAQVSRRESWPKFWAWREIRSETLLSSEVKRRYAPELCFIQGKSGEERLPRLSLTLANERGSPSEVFLRLSTTQKPKAVNAKGLNLKRADIMPLGFPLSGESDFLVLVEGPYDSLRTYQHLCDLGLGERAAVGALLGTGQWGHAWREKFLVNYLPMFRGTLVLAFDADDAGFNLTRQVVGDLKMYLPKERLKILSWRGAAKDPGDLSFEEFKAGWSIL